MIPTAEEFIQDRYDLNSEQLDDWRDQMKKMRGFDFDNIIDLMDSYAIEVAKFHVEAALKAASEKAKIINDPTCYAGNTGSEFEADKIVSRESILNAYPLTNIK